MEPDMGTRDQTLPGQGRQGLMMSNSTSALGHPVWLEVPEWMAPSHWAEHVPFAMWLTSVVRPRVLVELGTFRGTSYCGFCQAITALGLPTRSFAVDTWQGDPHNGANGPEILAELRGHHDPRYGHFSTLLPMTFDDAVGRFADGEIDLLHIDGYHTYEAVRHDFDTWRSRMSDRGVILFHDVAERIYDFGVWKLWAELTAEYPAFTFLHEHGLGVLAVGRDLAPEVRALVGLRSGDIESIRTLFEHLGRRARLPLETLEIPAGLTPDELAARLKEAWWHLEHEQALRQQYEQERVWFENKVSRLHEVERENVRLLEIECEQRGRADRSEQALSELQSSLTELQASLSWRLVRQASRVGGVVAPAGSARRRLLKRAARVGEIARRQGLGAVARKVARRVGERAVSPMAGWFESRAPWQGDDRPVFLLIHHHAAGGTLRHVRDLIAGLRAQNIRPVTLQPGRANPLLWEERDGDGRVSWSRSTAADPASVRAVLSELRPAHAHCHHMMGMPSHLVDQFVALGIRYDWSLHDYFAVCPRGHFQREKGAYCGEPDAQACQSCLARLGDYRGAPVSEPIALWRDRFAGYLAGARKVFVPSGDVRRRLSRYFPQVEIETRPYSETLPDFRRPVPPLGPGEAARVAVIGTIVEHKGSEVLLACARDARVHGLPLEFVVFGTTDCDAALARLGNVRLTGIYAEHQVYERLAAARCHVALLPTPVPETYMYTLSIAMAAGLFPVCFDLGAQADRVKAWGWGRPVPLGCGASVLNQALRTSAESIAGQTPPPAPATSRYPDTLESFYGFATDERRRLFSLPHVRAGSAVPDPNFVQRNVNARLH